MYLRKQLVIGGSTLDSVLSAESRLYEAESKEIRFRTEKFKSQVLIVSSLGLLSGAIGLVYKKLKKQVRLEIVYLEYLLFS